MMRLLQKNLVWKVIALGLAFGLWMLMNGSRELTMSLSVPVQYRNIPRSLEISSEIVEEAHLILRGPSTRLSRVEGANTPVIIDMGRVQAPGERTFNITRENVRLPSGVVLERVIPAQVRMNLETRIAREVPVVVRLSNVPEGMVVASQVATPPNLVISGPSSRVKRVEFVETDPVDVRVLDGQGETQAIAYSGDPQVHFTGPSTIKVKITLEPMK
jgi:YbbR domain-containing protein